MSTWLPTTGDTITQTRARQLLNRGTSDADIQRLTSFLFAIDTRSWIPTAWNSDNYPTTIEVRQGTTAMAVVTLTYDSDNQPTEMLVAADGSTATYTVGWTSNKWTGTTKTFA